MSEDQSGLQVVNGEEVILEPKKKSRKSKAEKLDQVVKTKRAHQWTEKTRAAFEKCREARLKNIERRKLEKQIQAEKEKEPVVQEESTVQAA